MRFGITPGAGDVLLVIDVQNDFCPGGGLAVPDGDRVVPVVNRIAPAFGQVVLTQDWHPPGHRRGARAVRGAHHRGGFGALFGCQANRRRKKVTELLISPAKDDG